MFDFLTAMLAGDELKTRSGETPTLNWCCPEVGVIVFEPKGGYSQNTIISAAVHGNETAPIEIINQLISAILNNQYQLNVRLMVIFGNIEAMREGERYLNIDLNRLFSDHHLQYERCYETQRALILQKVVADFYGADVDKPRFHFDLHTAIRASRHATFGLLPYLHCGRYQPTMINWLKSVGLEALVINHAPAATFSYFTSVQFAANSCTLELGKAKPFGENDLQQFSGIEQGLIDLITGHVADVHTDKQITIYNVADVITKQSEQFELNVADDVENFTAFCKGYVIASDGSAHYQVQQEHGYILFPNRYVKQGLRAGLLLVKGEL